MELFLDDFLNGIIHQVQDNLAPRLEKVTHHATERVKQQQEAVFSLAESIASTTRIRSRSGKPPSNTDIVYVTERFLASSQPAMAQNPTFLDTGRDETLHNSSVMLTVKSTNQYISATTASSSSQSHGTSKSIPRNDELAMNSLSDAGTELPETGRPRRALSDLPENPETTIWNGVSSSNIEENEATCLEDNMQRQQKLQVQVGENPQEGFSETIRGEEPAHLDSQGRTAAVPNDQGNSMNPVPDGNPRELSAVPKDITEDAVSALQGHTNYVASNSDDVKPGLVVNDPLHNKAKENYDKRDLGSVPILETSSASQKIPLHESMNQLCEKDDFGKMPDDNFSRNVRAEQDVSSRTGRLSVSTISLASSKEAIPLRRRSTQQVQSSLPAPQQQHLGTKRRLPSSVPILNSPGNMVTYLDKRHGKCRYLAMSLTDVPPDDRTLLLFRRQIVQLGWSSPCPDRSSLPSISQLLDVCYAIHAFLRLNDANVVLVYCENGRSRTGAVAACYLKFAGIVQSTEQGFSYFLSKSGMAVSPEKVLTKIPPSLRRLFRQFDDVLDRGFFLNRKPLLLKALALQGLPLEDEPCIDIWDASQRHVFSSHPELWRDGSIERPENRFGHECGQPVSKWLDEDGFYRLNVLLDGEFLLLCRFGGDFAEETTLHDPTKVLFRYANTTGCLSGGRPYELTIEHLDITKRYIDHMEDDFLVTLLFQADWEIDQEEEGNEFPSSIVERLRKKSERCGDRVWTCLDMEAITIGREVLAKKHSARPTSDDIKKLLQGCGVKEHEEMLEACSRLFLQLSNFDFGKAQALLLDSPYLSKYSERRLQFKSSRDDTKAPIPSVRHMLSPETKIKIQTMERGVASDILSILTNVSGWSILDKADKDVFQINGSGLATNASESYGRVSQPSDQDLVVSSIASLMPGDIVGSFSAIRRYESTDVSRLMFSKQKETQQSPLFPYVARASPRILHTRTGRLPLLDDLPESIDPARLDDRLAKEVHMRLPHTGVVLGDLIKLQRDAKDWIGTTSDSTSQNRESCTHPDKSVNITVLGESRDSSMNREAKGKREKKWIDDQKVEAEQKQREAWERKLSQERTREENNAHNPPSLIPLKDEPEYEKYFKMLKIGMPKEQVVHSMKRDEKDPTILDLDPMLPLRSQVGSKDKQIDADPPLESDPNYAKYFKMIKLGMPREQVLHAMKRDEKDPSILDLDSSKSLRSQQKLADDEGPPLKEDPEYAKYFKMLAMKLPIEAVKNALIRDGRDPSIMDLDHTKSVKSQLASKESMAEDEGPPLKDDPTYAKYFKMLAMKLPLGAVKNALARDGKDPSIMDLDPNKSLKTQIGKDPEEQDTGIPLKDDPEFSKYFKMEKMGLPRDAVKNALIRDGKDPTIMELDPNQSVDFQIKRKKTSTGAKKAPLPKKKKVRRKKIYWNPIDPGKIKEDSMWNIVRNYVAMDKLKYDEKEFEELFTETADPSEQKKKAEPKETKKLVQVIDPKRSMNGGIVLARLKTDYKKIAEHVDKMEYGKFDSTQLKALKEYLADPDEKRGLGAYMRKGEKSDAVKSQLYSELSETEKYMVTLMKVPDASAKLEAMLYRSVFTSRFQDITNAVKTLNAACDELRSSEKLRKLMAVILTVVNQINTGGEGNKAIGFTLDALLKLNEAKAFDKKTSVLHYVVKLVKKNDESLLCFESDITHVIPAENVLLDGVSSDVKAIRQELDDVIEIASADAQRLEDSGKLQKISLSELVEQKKMVQNVGIAPQLNKISRLTGRTSMERFALNAKIACEQASESIESVQSKYSMVLGYFGEDENMATGDFFGTLRRFMAEWKKAVDQVNKIERAQAKEKKRTAARAAKDARTSSDKKLSKLDFANKNHEEGNSVAKALKLGLSHSSANTMIKPTVSSGRVEPARPPPPGGVLTFAAAAAALKRSKHQEAYGANVLPESNPQVVIGSLAAQAALKRSQHKEGARAYTKPDSISLSVNAASMKWQPAEHASDREVKALKENCTKASKRDGADWIRSGKKRIASKTEKAFGSKGGDAHATDPAKEGDLVTYAVPKSPGEKGSKFLSSLSAYRKNKSKSHGRPNNDLAATDPECSQSLADTRFDSTTVDVDKNVPIFRRRTVEGPLTSYVEAIDHYPSHRDNDDNAVTLESFLDGHSTRLNRSEILRQNFDDSSVAIMTKDFERESIITSVDTDETWNGGGISDYIGWANLAIRSCDTESVRGFEHSHSLDYNQDFDDDSTIASAYFDDDSSIASGMTTPRPTDTSYFEDYQSSTHYALHQESNVPTVNPVSVAASILFSDSETESSVDHQKDYPNSPNSNLHSRPHGAYQVHSSDVIDMALSFNDAGIDAGLSFGTDVGFDDGLGFGHGSDDLRLNGFGPSPCQRDTNKHQPLSNDPNASTPPRGERAEKVKTTPNASTPPRGERAEKIKTTPTSTWFGGWGKGK